MQNSILKSVKEKLNLDPEDEAFDNQIIDYVNSAFAHLHQLGVGPAQGYAIENDVPEWGEFLGGDVPFLNNVRTYVCLYARLIFDPPESKFHISALEDQLREHEWRLTTAANPAPPRDIPVIDVY